MQDWDETRQQRLVKNEQAARGFNRRRESLEQSAGVDEDEQVPFLCECGDRECVETLALSLEEFDDAHSKPNRFVVRPGHVFPEVEEVVERRELYWLVEKNPELMTTS